MDFTAFGEVLIDMISDDYEKSLADVKSFNKYFGGSPANIAVNLSKQGFKTRIISKTGNDFFGDFISSYLKNNGVNTDNIIRSPENNTDIVFVLKSKDNPQFYPYRSSTLNLEIPYNYEELINNTKIFHFSFWSISSDKNLINTKKMISYAFSENKIIGFDPNYRKILSHNSDNIKYILKSFLKYTTLIKPSEDDCFHIFGEMSENSYIDILHDMGAQNIIMTLGKNGYIVSDGKKRIKYKSAATQVIDTTGAGDAFWTGTYIGLLNSENIFDSAFIGNIFAAEKLKSTGSVAEIENYKTLIKKYL